MWWMYAIIGAIAAGATNALIKAGMKGVDSYTATAIRALLIVPVVWVVALVLGKVQQIPAWSSRNWIFLSLSALAAGISWVAAYKAIDLAGAARPGPIDKSSMVITAVLAYIWLGEPISWRLAAAYALVTPGAILSVQPGKAVAQPTLQATVQPGPASQAISTTLKDAPLDK